MSELFYPQLSSGAIAHYPIRKVLTARTVRNMLADGSVLSYSDASAGRLVWQLGYNGLSAEDLNMLLSHFNACQGRLQAFTFIDPTDNMLRNSADLASSSWQYSTLIQFVGNVPDPAGGNSAFAATNNGQTNQEIVQTLHVPGGYQYCFSIYVRSVQPAPIRLSKRSVASNQSIDSVAVASWSRIVCSGVLSDNTTGLTVAISLPPGEQIFLFGAQLEAQILPSRYRPTYGSGGGVYANAHWGVDELSISADAPNLFSTTFTIETAI